ncbi:MAG: signal peptidase Serine peptidase, partial [Bryobacterales bacterium]|nr:signal peptidase Serine peptidase [Bryobacterales bacterium]
EWAVNFIILIFATSTVAQPFVIPTASMEGTLMTGDHLIVDKLAYAPPGPLTKNLLPYEDVKRGDVIVFRYPLDISQTWVKRVVGVPGDHIRLENRQVIRNGQQLTEPYVQHVFPNYNAYRDDFPSSPPVSLLPQSGRDMLAHNMQAGEIVVPPGRYFAMGDNRDNSDDSRYWGFVPRENIIGKPVIVFWSYDAPTEDLTGYTIHHAVDLAGHFFTRTRWQRTLKLVRNPT